MDRFSILCYNSSMSNIVIIGKDLPDNVEIAESFAAKGRNVFVTSKTEAESASFESENIFATTFNKASSISAHSLIIKAETKFDRIDEVLFYFDASNFATKFELDKSEEIAMAVDSMINSYLYIAAELLKRIDQRKEKMIVSFLVKEYPSKAETLLSKTTGIVPASNVVSIAQAAFESLAENFATSVAERNYLSVLLAKCSYGSEAYKFDKVIGDWICEAMESTKNLKNPQTVKQAVVWNKVGGKVQTGFSLFH